MVLTDKVNKEKKLDKQSASGKDGLTKKGGAGGRHTWGAAGTQVGPSGTNDPNDPNYEEPNGLLDSDGDWYLPKAEAAMSKIFARFDADNDGCWDVKEIQAFANATNGKDFNDQEMTEFDNFEQKDGKLTETGFLNLYHLQITSYPDEVWKDLSALGLDRQEFVTAATKNAHDGVKKAAYQKPEVANHRLYEGVTLASVQELQKALAKNLRRLDRKIDADHSTYDEKEIVNVALERGRILKALEKLQG